MKITITIHTENAAFEDDQYGIAQEGSMPETARILGDLSRRFAAGSWPMDGPILDYNGNTVGRVTVEES